MQRHQSATTQWLVIVAEADHGTALAAARRLPRGSGVLVIGDLEPGTQRTLRLVARRRGLRLANEAAGDAARVHDVRELRSALLQRTPLILLSPLFPTASHPTWAPLRRMRAATLAQLSGRRLIALGGMDAKRYARLAPLGFIGWAGRSAFRT